ncbi:MAG: DUF5694 domain-containing protein [Planctomycetota bacterium]
MNVPISLLALALGTGLPHTQAQQVADPPARTAAAINAAAEARVAGIFEAAGIKPRRLLLLGTFHFKDAGLDAYKPQHRFDALSERRQGEIAEVIDRLDGFDADVVCVEARPESQTALDQRFGAFRAGEWDLPANEIYQLGFRLADREGLEGVHAVDAAMRWMQPQTDTEAWARENDQEHKLDSPLMRTAYPVFIQSDREVDAWHLIDTLLARNATPRLEASHGGYLTEQFAVGNGEAYPGVDGFVTTWHNRNLRIFQNIINASEPGDDVVVVIGVGHVPLLRHMAQCSPDFELVEVVDVLGDG